jgi:hypothetical protein
MDVEENSRPTNSHGHSEEEKLPRKATISIEEIGLQPMRTSSGLKWRNGCMEMVMKTTCEWMETKLTVLNNAPLSCTTFITPPKIL